MSSSPVPPKTDLRSRVEAAAAWDVEAFRIELIRKSIHLCSLSIPILYFYTPRDIALMILVPLTLGFVAVDVTRHYSERVDSLYRQTFGWMLRQHELANDRIRLNGATYVVIAATLAVFLFPKIITVTSFSILIISDLTAALVGRRFGRHRLFQKSMEGTIGFFASAVLVVLVLPKIGYHPAEYAVGFVAAVAGALAEAVSTGVDDNLSVPISVGIVLWGGYALFLPHLNVYAFG